MKKFLKVVCIVLVVLLAAYIILGALERPQNYTVENPMLSTDGLPILIAHGGGNLEFPDNTLEAYYNAYSIDHNVIMESDVSITKDGVIILSHDTTLDRKTNVTGNIIDWNYTDLIEQRVDFGYTNPVDDDSLLAGDRVHFTAEDGEERYPTDVEYPEGVEPRDEEIFYATTLEEMLIAFPNNRISVEIKQSGETGMTALREVIRLLDEYDAFDRVVVASFHEEIFNEFQRLQQEDEVPDCFLCSPAQNSVTKFFVTQLLNADSFYTDRIAVFQIPTSASILNLATSGLVEKAHSHNLAVHYWTIDDEETMRQLIEIGADGIETNYPHKLAAILDEYREG